MLATAGPSGKRSDFTPPLPSGRGQGEGAASRKTIPLSRDITKRRPGRTEFARKLRADETDEEYHLWSDLRNRRLNGYKFARQIPLGPYVVDFLCRERRLVIELDGGQHCENLRDVARTRWLNANGYSVIRFWNNEIEFERQAVLETILAVLDGRIFETCETIRFAPAPPPHPTLSPRGEGKPAIETTGRGTF